MRLHIKVEATTNKGRIDAIITLDDHIYLFEFKFNKTAQEALDQIHERQYYEKYLSQPKPITLVVPSRMSRNLLLENIANVPLVPRTNEESPVLLFRIAQLTALIPPHAL